MTPSTFTTPACGVSQMRVQLEQRHAAGQVSDAEYLKWSAKLDALKTIRPARWLRLVVISVATAVVTWILVTVVLNLLP